MMNHRIVFQTKDVFLFTQAEPLFDELAHVVNTSYGDKGIKAGVVVTESYEAYEIEGFISDIPDLKLWNELFEIARYILESLLPR